MKKNLIILFQLLFFGFCGCQKDKELKTPEPMIIEEIVIPSPTSTAFIWSVDFPGKLEAVVQVSQNENMAEASAVPATYDNGKFKATIEDLSLSSQYYYRYILWNQYFIENKMVLETKCFSTLGKPIVSTSEITNITWESASVSGNVICDGGTTVTERGVCWGLNHNPTIEDEHLSVGMGIGLFYSDINNLSFGTCYYVRAYAINIAGISYGDEISFK